MSETFAGHLDRLFNWTKDRSYQTTLDNLFRNVLYALICFILLLNERKVLHIGKLYASMVIDLHLIHMCSKMANWVNID